MYALRTYFFAKSRSQGRILMYPRNWPIIPKGGFHMITMVPAIATIVAIAEKKRLVPRSQQNERKKMSEMI